LNLLATSNTLPTHVVLLELTEDELTKRLSAKENDSIESRGIDYLLNIQDRLKQAIIKMDLNHIFINASEPIDSIATKIDNFLKS